MARACVRPTRARGGAKRKRRDVALSSCARAVAAARLENEHVRLCSTCARTFRRDGARFAREKEMGCGVTIFERLWMIGGYS